MTNLTVTNIRFPDEDYKKYQELARKKNVSSAHLVRSAMDQTYAKDINKGALEKKAKKILDDLVEFRKRNAKYFKGLDSTRMIREMRDES